MKLFFAFAALAAASTTTQPTTVDVAQSTGAQSTESLTAADDDSDDVFDPQEEDEEGADGIESYCSYLRDMIVEIQTIGIGNWEEYDEAMEEVGSEDAYWIVMEEDCSDLCLEEGQSDCSDLFATASETTEDPLDDAADEACTAAQGTYAASANDLEKVANLAACDLACADIEGETCGSLVNSLSFALFAILSILKY